MAERRYTEFEGRDVIASGIEMPGASGGLNKALAVDGIEWHHGDEGTIVLHYRVNKVRFDPIKDTDALARAHVLEITNAAQIDTDLVEGQLAEQTRRNDLAKRAAEEAKGVQRLPGTDGLDDDEPGGAMPVNGDDDDLADELDTA